MHGSEVGKPARGLSVSSEVTAEHLSLVLEDLAAGASAHTWSPYARRRDASGLIEAEHALRPTKFFAYFVERELAAVATVADRLRHDFKHDGIPVLARCVVLRAFRGRGLYRAIFHHRVRYCEVRFGNRLRAIHLGTAAAPVLRVAGEHGFVEIGKQEVDGRPVSALLRFAPGFAAEVGAGVERRHCPRPSDHPAALVVSRMKALVAEMLSSGLAPDGHAALASSMHEVARLTTWSPAEHVATSALLDLFHAVPLARVA